MNCDCDKPMISIVNDGYDCDCDCDCDTDGISNSNTDEQNDDIYKQDCNLGECVIEIESIEINGNYSYAPDFEIVTYDDKYEICTECAFCKRNLYEYSYNIITDNKSLLNDNKIVIGKCGHMFHKDCMDSWVKCGNMICPIDKVTWEEHRIADNYTALPIINKNKNYNKYKQNYNKYKQNYKSSGY